MSLLEVIIASFLTVIVASLAASFSSNMTRVLADSIVDTKLAREARLAIESIRRDQTGSAPASVSGLVESGRLVGQINFTGTQLRLCYDGGTPDGWPSWGAPDRVVTYQHVDNRLIRIDSLDDSEYTVARDVDEFTVTTLVDGMQIDLTLARRGHSRDFSWIIAKL